MHSGSGANLVSTTHSERQRNHFSASSQSECPRFPVKGDPWVTVEHGHESLSAVAGVCEGWGACGSVVVAGVTASAAVTDRLSVWNSCPGRNSGPSSEKIPDPTVKHHCVTELKINLAKVASHYMLNITDRLQSYRRCIRDSWCETLTFVTFCRNTGQHRATSITYRKSASLGWR